MATTVESKKMITLRSYKGEELEMEESVAMEFQTIKHAIEEFRAIQRVMGDRCAESVILLPKNVSRKVLSKLIGRSKKHRKMIMLRSSDGEEFAIEESVAKEFKAIKHMIGTRRVIPVPNVNSKVLPEVIEYSKKHKHVDSSSSMSDEKTADEELKAWDAEFMKARKGMLSDLMMAAYYLNIKSLLHLVGRSLWMK